MISLLFMSGYSEKYPINNEIDPGPDSKGIAIGVKEISSFSIASALTLSPILLLDVSPLRSAKPDIIITSPPAPLKAGMLTPKKPNMYVPAQKKLIRIRTKYILVNKEVLFLSSGVSSAVRDRNIGIAPKGFTTENNDANIVIAKVNNLLEVYGYMIMPVATDLPYLNVYCLFLWHHLPSSKGKSLWSYLYYLCVPNFAGLP